MVHGCVRTIDFIDVTAGCGNLAGSSVVQFGVRVVGAWAHFEIKFVLSEIRWDWGDSWGMEDGLLVSKFVYCRYNFVSCRSNLIKFYYAQ